MPSPVTPRRTAKARDTSPKKSKVDIGKPLGEFDNNSVRDRVRQWQSQGGGVITASDIFVEQEDAESPPSKPIKTSSSKHNVQTEGADESEIPQKRAGRRKENETEEPPRPRYRSISTPRKRVVSDGHWRAARSPPLSAELSKVERAPPKKTIPDDGIRVTPMPDAKSTKARRRREESSSMKNPPVAFNDGIRVYSTPLTSRRESSHTNTASDDSHDKRSEISEEGYSNSRSVSPPRKPTPRKRLKDPSPEQSLLSLKAGDCAGTINARRRSSMLQQGKGSEASPGLNQGSFAEIRGSKKSAKGNILSNLFSRQDKQEPIPSPAPNVSSVEAWLNQTTDDPFVEEGEPPVEVPAPLKSSSPAPNKPSSPIPQRISSPQEKTKPKIVPVDDPNKIWEELEKKDSQRSKDAGSRRHRNSRKSSTSYQLVADDYEPEPTTQKSNKEPGTEPKSLKIEQNKPELSPPLLQRRGAKRNGSSSPTKECRKSSPLKESFTPTTEESDSMVSSANTTSSVEPLDPALQLRPNGTNNRRSFPSTGKHRLSTIASVETFNTASGCTPAPSISERSESTVHPIAEPADDLVSEARDQFDPRSLQRSKSRITKHSDLMSVLSMPRGSGNSIRSARSIRTNRSRLATASIDDVMRELATDESKYMRELRTLVDGVIPVLLTCVLSKSDSAIAAGLFSPNTPENDPTFTKPIIDMGIALERLKSLHKRIPSHRPDALLTWAQGAQRVYGEYLKAWRLGFKDVIVNLASPEDEQKSELSSTGTNLDGALPRNKDGDVVDTNGERVDVAYLLKRPLVRLKYLAKTLRAINLVRPSTEAADLASVYQELVIEAKRRNNEEEARLEDEAAANIDPTRARDLQTLGPLLGVVTERSRRVRARDLFDLTLLHTSGQRLDCHVELFLRDDAPGQGTSGDVLICEVDGTGRWLLFPPIQMSCISSRNGDSKGEIVVMIRGVNSADQEWHELLSLCAEDEQTGFEWVQMLGLIPSPPQIMRVPSFMRRAERRKTLMAPLTGLKRIEETVTLAKSRTPSPREMEVPIGELAVGKNVKTWIDPLIKETVHKYLPAPVLQEKASLLTKGTDPSEPFINKTDERRLSEPLSAEPNKPLAHASQARYHNKSTTSSNRASTPRDLNDAVRLAGSSGSSLKRTKATRHSRQQSESAVPGTSSVLHSQTDSASSIRTSLPTSPLYQATPSYSPAQSQLSERSVDIESSLTPSRLSTPDPTSTASGRTQLSSKDTYQRKAPSPKPSSKDKPTRPSHHRSKSSAPSLELPIIPKVRQSSPSPSPTSSVVDEPEPDWNMGNKFSRIKGGDCISGRIGNTERELEAPLPPTHVVSVKSSGESPNGRGSPSSLERNRQSPSNIRDTRSDKRRSSSPLKHEYEPSSGSDSASESDASTVEHHGAELSYDSGTSDEEEEDIEGGDVATPLIPIAAVERITRSSAQQFSQSTSPPTLSPSPSTSQTPANDVPDLPKKTNRAIAMVSYWDNSGDWKHIYPDECSIVITPGLLEVFEMSPAHSGNASNSSDNDTPTNANEPSASGRCPLIALELTPLVPIRKGTAIDITIRSPPTAESRFKTKGTNNIMFRSRSLEECEILYFYIHDSRMNNPTYIALENARNANQFGGASFDRGSSSRGSKSPSWFGFIGRRKSYRATSEPTPSAMQSDSSVRTSASMFSALARFRRGSSRFSIARSSVTSRDGSRAASGQISENSGSETSTPMPLNIQNATTPIGLSNLKVRLYIRESKGKWTNLGSGRLTIMLPTNAAHPPISNSQPAPRLEAIIGTGVGIGAGGGVSLGGRSKPTDKRIVVVGKPKIGEEEGKTLLDVTLDESSFERIARVGIAVSVWENFESGRAANEGGVAGGRVRVYMLHMNSEAETAYTFSIVGKERYS